MQVHYQASGAGEPAVLFVHGYGCALDDWDAQVARLAPRFRCIAIDLPGHGGSALPPSPTLAALAEAVNQVRREAGVRQVVLVGHSLGTRVVTDACLQAPEGVRGLVFVDGRYYEGGPDEAVGRMAALVDARGLPAFLQQAFAGMFTAHSDPQLRDRVTRRATRIDPAFGRAILLESVLWDAGQGAGRMSRIPVPVLLLQSSDIDAGRRLISLRPGMRTRYMEVVSQRVADAEVRVVPGVGHFAALEAPQQVGREIERFVARVAQREP